LVCNRPDNLPHKTAVSRLIRRPQFHSTLHSQRIGTPQRTALHDPPLVYRNSQQSKASVGAGRLGNSRCPGVSMYQKDNRFYADWRDRRGVRRRKAFTSADAATAYEEEQKNAARPKTRGAGLQLPRSSAPGRQRGPRSNTKTAIPRTQTLTTQPKLSSLRQAAKPSKTSPNTISPSRQRPGWENRSERATNTLSDCASFSAGSRRSTTRQPSPPKSRVSSSQRLGTSQRRTQNAPSSSKQRQRT
jgi:hypothetical protein